MRLIFVKQTQLGLRTVALIFLSILLMVFDARAVLSGQIRAALSVPLVPLQYLVNWPVSLIDKLSQTVSSHDKLVKENVDLKAEQLFLKAQVQRLMAIESENNQLKALLQSSSRIKGKMEIAQLLAVASDPFVHQVILDKGTKDKVYIGQPVLDATGVMGQITQTGPLLSRVLLINDPRSGVPVQNTRNGIRAIASGDLYSDKLRLLNVPHTSDIQAGDILITSGLGQVYPEGYPVGKVITVAHDYALPFATIILEPSAHLDQSRQVLLIWPNGVKHDA